MYLVQDIFSSVGRLKTRFCVTVTLEWFINQAMLNSQKEVKVILSFLDVFNKLSDHTRKEADKLETYKVQPKS